MAKAIRITALRPRSKIKDWVVETKLGSGTYGEVWKAKHHRMGSFVAVKSFARLAQIVRKDTLIREILRETIAMARIQHENVVAFNTDYIERGCIVFEFVPNSLQAEMKRRGAADWFSQDEALTILRGILEGLGAIHAKNIVHGDIKPANILLTERLTPKMSDFGMASILSAQRFPCPFFHGSNNWAAPEVLSGEKPDFQSDLFSVGIIAYLLFTGHHPFHREDPTCLSRPEDHISNTEYSPQSATVHNNSVPAPISEIIDKLLQRDRDKRYKNVQEVLMALTEVEAPTAPTETEVTSAKSDVANEIGYSIVEAKRLFHTEFDSPAALKILTDVIDKFKSSNIRFLANAFSYKAFIHNYLQQWGESIKAASEGIKIDPNHCDSYMARGYAYSRKGFQTANHTLLESARDDLNKAKLLAPNYTKRQQAQKYLNEVVSDLSTPEI